MSHWAPMESRNTPPPAITGNSRAYRVRGSVWCCTGYLVGSQQPCSGSGDDLLSDSIQNNVGRAVQVELLHDVGAVSLDRVRAQVQRGCDFFVGLAFCQKLKNLFLTLRQQIVTILQAALL